MNQKQPSLLRIIIYYFLLKWLITHYNDTKNEKK